MSSQVNWKVGLGGDYFKKFELWSLVTIKKTGLPNIIRALLMWGSGREFLVESSYPDGCPLLQEIIRED